MPFQTIPSFYGSSLQSPALLGSEHVGVYVHLNFGDDIHGNGTMFAPWKTIQRAFSHFNTNNIEQQHVYIIGSNTPDYQTTGKYVGLYVDYKDIVLQNAQITIEGFYHTYPRHFNTFDIPDLDDSSYFTDVSLNVKNGWRLGFYEDWIETYGGNPPNPTTRNVQLMFKNLKISGDMTTLMGVSLTFENVIFSVQQIDMHAGDILFKNCVFRLFASVNISLSSCTMVYKYHFLNCRMLIADTTGYAQYSYCNFIITDQWTSPIELKFENCFFEKPPVIPNKPIFKRQNITYLPSGDGLHFDQPQQASIEIINTENLSVNEAYVDTTTAGYLPIKSVKFRGGTNNAIGKCAAQTIDIQNETNFTFDMSSSIFLNNIENIIIKDSRLLTYPLFPAFSSTPVPLNKTISLKNLCVDDCTISLNSSKTTVIPTWYNVSSLEIEQIGDVPKTYITSNDLTKGIDITSANFTLKVFFKDKAGLGFFPGASNQYVIKIPSSVTDKYTTMRFDFSDLVLWPNTLVQIIFTYGGDPSGLTNSPGDISFDFSPNSFGDCISMQDFLPIQKRLSNGTGRGFFIKTDAAKNITFW